MRVAVLGAGNGGVASAFDFAQHGHDVSLYATPEFGTNLVAVDEAGGITASGDLEGFAPIRYAGQRRRRGHGRCRARRARRPGVQHRAARRRGRAPPDRRHGRAGLPRVVRRRDRLQARGRARARRRALRRRRDQHAAVRGADHRAGRRSTCSSSSRPGVYLAGLPRAGTDRLYDLVKDVWPAVEKAESVFQTTLQNGNPVIHPAVTLLNAGLLERTGGDFLFYEEGVTESVGRLIEAVDNERLAIAAALGSRSSPSPRSASSRATCARRTTRRATAPRPASSGIAAQSQLDHRYLTEDVGYSLVFLADLAARLGVPTPVIDAVITIASVVLARDFRGEGVRTVEHARPGRPVPRGARRPLITRRRCSP